MKARHIFNGFRKVDVEKLFKKFPALKDVDLEAYWGYSWNRVPMDHRNKVAREVRKINRKNLNL